MGVEYPLNTLLSALIWLCAFRSILCDITINEISCGIQTKAFVELRSSADYSASNKTSFMLNVYNDSDIVSSNTFNLTKDSYQLTLIASESFQPPAGILLDNTTWLPCDSDFVVLYQLEVGQTIPANTDIMDAVVYNGSSHMNASTDLASNLLSRGEVVTLPNDGSLGRCDKTFSAKTQSPGTANDCPVPPIIINEVNVDNPSIDRAEYIELFDGGGGNTTLDGLLLVFYNGNGDKSVYEPLSLNGYQTNGDGYFVMGQGTVDNVDLVIDKASNWIQNGPDAIVLHYGKPEDFPKNALASNKSVVDVLVYGTNDSPLGLLAIFTPGQMQVNEDWSHHTGDEAIMRCFSNDAISLASFIVGKNLTAGKENVCPYPPVVINEVYFDNTNQTSQFIEISSTGVSYFPLRKLVLVLFNKDNTSAAAIAVDKFTTDEKGFYVLDAIPKVASADVQSIILYLGLTADFPDKSELKSTKSYVHMLNDVDEYYAADKSVSLCVNETDTFLKTTNATRGAANVCFDIAPTTAPPATTPGSTNAPVIVTSKVYINELNADTPSLDTHEFIELRGPPKTSLNGTSLVLYNGANNKVYLSIPLDGFETDANGFFVVGSANVVNVDLIQPNNFVQNGPDAVVFYQLPVDRFKDPLPEPINEGVIDVIIYSKYSTPAQGLLDIFTTNQTQILEAGYYVNSDHSITRCWPATRDLTSFILATPTPGAENNCTPPSVFVNEVNIGVNESFYVELATPTNTSFDGLVLVFYIEANDTITSYAISLRNKFSVAGEYFLVGGSGTNAVESDTEIRYTYRNLHLQMEPASAVAIALFQGVSSLFVGPTVPPNVRLVDSIILGDSSTMLANLKVSQAVVPLTQELKSGNSSVSLCNNCPSQGALLVDIPTPREINNCSTCPASTAQPSTEASTVPVVSTAAPVQGMIMNEIVVSDDISKEFVELKGAPNTALDDFTLVFYKSSSKPAVWDLPLTGYSTDASGLFVLSGGHLDATSPAAINKFLRLDNEVMAIVLYSGTQGPFVVDTSKNIIDFIVYTITSEGGSVSPLPAWLFPTGHVTPILVSSGESVSRCLGASAMDFTAFIISKPTQGKANSCKFPTMFINEISPTENGTDDFIELRAEVASAVSLTSLFLRVFNGTDDQIYRTINLMNMKTNPQGLFKWTFTATVGSQDKAHLPLPSGGVALYQGNPISAGSPPKLLDAVVYGASVIQSLLKRLLPGQGKITLTDDVKYGRQSISRCFWCQPKMQTSFLLTRPTPERSNDCASVKTLPRLVINELSTSTSQFIELKGDNNTDVSDYKVILFGSDAKAYQMFALSCMKTDAKGFIMIGPKSNPNAKIQLNTDLVADLAAVALYDGRIRVDDELSNIGIVDALVYGSSYKASELINVLTPNSTMFVLDFNVFTASQDAISRCKNNYNRNSTMYLVSNSTPAEPNVCEFNSKISVIIQLKLDTADCNQFKENQYASMTAIVDAIVKGVNNDCKCGLSQLYFKDHKFYCGSVIFEALMVSSSQEHLDVMLASYKKYIGSGPSITVNDEAYPVNSSCYDTCYVAVKPTPAASGNNSQVTVTIAVIVTVLVVFGLIVVFVVIYIRKKRKGILHFRLARFDNNDEDFVDFDEPAGSENASFSNPLYAKLN